MNNKISGEEWKEFFDSKGLNHKEALHETKFTLYCMWSVELEMRNAAEGSIRFDEQPYLMKLERDNGG